MVETFEMEIKGQGFKGFQVKTCQVARNRRRPKVELYSNQGYLSISHVEKIAP